MNRHQPEDALLQLRTAQRIVAAFYQRLLPLIERTAAELELDFYFWNPKNFARPRQMTANPFKHWKWDMLPALSSYYVFKNVEDVNHIKVGEYLVEFLVTTDSGVDAEIPTPSEPDALNLTTTVADAQSTLRIRVLTPYLEQNTNWYHNIWSACRLQEHPSIPHLNYDPALAIVAKQLEIPMSELMHDGAVEDLVPRVREVVETVVSSAAKLK